MNDYFDVFFHQQAIPFTTGTVLYQKDSTDEIVDACETFYEERTGELFTFRENSEISRKVLSLPLKKHVEIQFFQAELNWDVLLEELEELFPQFIWTKIVEEVDGSFSTYYCEFISVSLETHEEDPVAFSVSASLEQMDYTKQQSVSSILEAKFLSIFQEEGEETYKEPLTFPVAVTVEEPQEEEVFSFKEEEVSDESEGNENFFSSLVDELEEEETFSDILLDEFEENEPYTDTSIDEFEDYETLSSTSADEPEEVEAFSSASVAKPKENKLLDRSRIEQFEDLAPVRSDENEVLYLKESLKREKASKERVRVAKEKLEYELLAIENSLLVSGLKRFKKHQKTTIDEEDWYKPVRIDLIQYDDLYKKAKFIEQSWRLNRQLVTITEKMTVTKDQWIYERARIEKIKNSVSEMDLQSMMEQCHLINERVKVRPGFLFFKPRVKLYQIDYEQLEKISAFFDIIQTENRLLESVIEQKEQAIQ
ncbi:hypothetical protein [Enterococcus termitis]|uniref:Uncharacterized protein n=1 Tax=Enterococcus termitis TaxID=332950 RepID=A0A1E5H4D5_9ENTE|nr:hypothetical protein [Enterococcus termitis]OEG19742.1 hypothetical protein BCR25_14945 [Enterococcus termitis]OJG96769.1 hypothetical protein RV18_GL001904 [Enterococcus termitis]